MNRGRSGQRLLLFCASMERAVPAPAPFLRIDGAGGASAWSSPQQTMDAHSQRTESQANSRALPAQTMPEILLFSLFISHMV